MTHLEPLIPRPEQREAIDTLLSNPSEAALLGAGMGTGKTLIATQYCKEVGAQTVLIAGPLQTMGAPIQEGDERHKGWWGTFQRQQVPLNFRQIDSTLAGKKALADLQWGVPGVYFVGQELFARWGWRTEDKIVKGKPVQKWNAKKGVWETEQIKVRTTIWDFKVDVFIFDEIHRAANSSSATFKTLMGMGPKRKLRVHPKTFLGLSGTYEGNSFDGAWAVTRALWGDFIDANKYLWRSKWAETVYDHFAVRNERVVGEKNPGAFVSHLPCYIHIEAEFDIQVDDRTFLVTLPPLQRKVYDDLDKRMVAWIRDNPMVVKFPITKRIRQRQTTLGLPNLVDLGNGDYEVNFDLDCESVKIDHPKDGVFAILEGFFESEPALIYTDSQQFAEVLTYRLNKKYGEGSAREWSGQVKRKVRDDDLQDFMDGKYKYFVAVIKASGTGTDGLQHGARNMLYVSSDDSRIDNDQSFSRLYRDGLTGLLRVARILAKDTIDVGQRSKAVEEALAANKRKKRIRR